MLAEFYLTPHAFADDDRSNGEKVVEALEKTLFLPELNKAANVPLVCKLGGEKWFQETSKQVACIPDSNHQRRAMKLLLKLERDHRCVDRPEVATDGNGESDWCAAGIQSSKDFPVEKIIASSKQRPIPNLGCSIGDFISEKFWDAYKNPRVVHRNIEDQKKSLLAICAHSDWMIIRMPQLRGSDDGEEVTVKQILEIVSLRPKGFSDRKMEISLHAQTREESNIPDERLRGNIWRHLQGSIGANTKLNINVCSKVTNRELLAGKFRKTSDGNIVKDALWVITMNHVAVKSRKSSKDGSNKWTLEGRPEAHERLEDLEAEAR